MAFTKGQVREILKNFGVEEIKSDMVKELCDLHSETLQDTVAKAEEKVIKDFKVEDSETYKDVKQELDELRKNSNKNTKVEESEIYKSLKSEYEEFKANAEAEKTEQKAMAIKKAELEKLGLKGSVRDLILRDKFDFEFDEKGEAKEDSLKAYATTISESYKDLIVEEKGGGGVTGNQSGKSGSNGGVTLESFNKMGYSSRVKFKETNPEQYDSFVKQSKGD